MILKYLKFCSLFALFFSFKNIAQETLPIYQDYLSDNVYLVHPSAAGIGNSSKLRFTARQQWSGIADAPALQTISFHSRFGEETNAAYGFVLFNDKNGYHSQKGVQATYAYHLPLNDNGHYFEQLSFGLSFSFIQNQSDQRSFGNDDVAAIIESTSYYNSDFSAAYHRGGFSSYFTVKNLFLTAKNNLNVLEPLNLRNYVFSVGYYYDKNYYFQLEPSFMLQLKEGTGQKISDFNLKGYKTLNNYQLWLALSYRVTFGADVAGNSQFISPIFGLNYKNVMFSYTYTNQIGDVVLTKSGFHQITLGINLWTRNKTWRSTPNINNSFIGF
ncbi:type IX secretion system membrane protein PorP/SprF [Polaribacter sp. Z014]|uniref:PorP/SprF family type IX secretion system membrane protein n=1 Tax=unclassified Polaribacter TaxID=196858 RepID=UPI00193BF5A6|nr:MULTISPECIES: type IX secretion system membrane protein PorP/SprF [unclassified Polaribacter]MCL7764267.1 type IX secretion system membrane protein PorP/SprF [Polaribacter sp. Z014]QVY65070.1 type IX secretion system membrane protein PorP/SprF [Polaribacter sp. Q13]